MLHYKGMRTLRRHLLIAVAAGLGLAVLNAAPATPQTAGASTTAAVPVYRYKVVRSYPHDRQAFTQGLVYLNGVFYEGTGQLGQSTIRKVRVESGEVLQNRPIDARYFGEGIVIWKDSLVQLTWQHGIGFVYDRDTFQPKRTFNYSGEGWGLTHDGTRIIMSDGTATLRFLDPETLKETGRLTVRDGNAPIAQLNELEFVKGEIYANVWQTERIARISPKTGRVTGWIDLE